MQQTRDGGPAFPGSEVAGNFWGMSLRDWFAGQAIAAAVEQCRGLEPFEDEVAERAYEIADAMLAERAKP